MTLQQRYKMKDGADTNFVEAVIKSGLGTAERQPKNCQATHVFRQEGHEHVLPVKVFLETASQEWKLMKSEPDSGVRCKLVSFEATIVLMSVLRLLSYVGFVKCKFIRQLRCQ